MKKTLHKNQTVSPNQNKPQSHIALNIINRCNQRCIFCFEGNRSNKITPPYEDVVKLLNETAKKTKHVVFMGGEALLRKDIFDILAYADSIGLTTSIFTNGQILANPDILKKCAEHKVNTLSISINSFNENNFVKTTRTKALHWDRLMMILKNINEHLIESKTKNLPSIHFNFNVLVTKLNVNHLCDIVQLICEKTSALQKPDFFFKQMQPFGNKKQQIAQSIRLRASFTKLRLQCDKLLKLFSNSINMVFNGFPLCVLPCGEHFSLELKQIVTEYEILCNFLSQDTISPMQGSFSPLVDTYKEICKNCSLITICPGTFTKSHWPDFKPSTNDIPFPSSKTPYKILCHTGLSKQQAYTILSRFKAYNYANR